MQARIAACYSEINPFVKFPKGHAPADKAEVEALIDELVRLVYAPGSGVRYPTRRHRIVGLPTVYEVKMMFYLEALIANPSADPRYEPEKNDHHMLIARDGGCRMPKNPYEEETPAGGAAAESAEGADESGEDDETETDDDILVVEGEEVIVLDTESDSG